MLEAHLKKFPRPDTFHVPSYIYTPVWLLPPMALFFVCIAPQSAILRLRWAKHTDNGKTVLDTNT